MLIHKSIKLVAINAFIAFTSSFVVQAQETPTDSSYFFQNGDTPAVFLGDSITEAGTYATLIETYTLTRFPNMKVTFRNTGWGGDTSWLVKRGDFDAGLQRDVLSLKPKSVMIDFGMNDARGGDATYNKYVESTTNLVKSLEKAGARVALLTPSPEEKYESGAPAGSHYNLMLKKYCDGLKVVSDNEKIPLIDQFTPFISAVEAGRKAGVLSTTEGPTSTRLTFEGVHPNMGGHLIMATAILQAFHAPSLVSSVAIDAASKSITSSAGCMIEWQDLGNGVVQFKRTDEVMPWPIPADPTIDMVLKIPGFDPATTLNSYMLQVTGLTEKAYTLLVDGKAVGIYPSADLAKGINLGFTRQGPIFEQAQQLLDTVMDKNKAYYNRWRNVQLGVIPDWLKNYPTTEQARTTELAKLDKQIAADEQKIEELRKPVPHVFKLVPAPK